MTENKYVKVYSMKMNNLFCDNLISLEYEDNNLLLVVCNKMNDEMKIRFIKVSYFNYLDEDFYIKEKLNYSIDAGNVYEVTKENRKLFVVSTYSHIIEIAAEAFENLVYE